MYKEIIHNMIKNAISDYMDTNHCGFFGDAKITDTISSDDYLDFRALATYREWGESDYSGFWITGFVIVDTGKVVITTDRKSKEW